MWRRRLGLPPIVIWNRTGNIVSLGFACANCAGFGDVNREQVNMEFRSVCPDCGGLGWFGIDPEAPSNVLLGEPGRLAMLQVRFAAGVSLWHPGDAMARESVHARRKQVLDSDRGTSEPMPRVEASFT